MNQLGELREQPLEISSYAKLLHDPSTGFHDIKPLPEFHPVPIGLIVGLAAAALLMLLFYYWYKKQFQREGMRSFEQQLPPNVRALEEIRTLERAAERNAISVDELSARASITLRRFIEEVYGFGATDCTTKELLSVLLSSMQSKPTHFPTADAKQAVKNAASLFSFLDYLSFAGDASVRYPVDSSSVKQQLEAAAGFVRTVHQRAEQMQTVSSQEEQTHAV